MILEKLFHILVLYLPIFCPQFKPFQNKGSVMRKFVLHLVTHKNKNTLVRVSIKIIGVQKSLNFEWCMRGDSSELENQKSKS